MELSEILSAFGFTSEIALSVTNAIADPTSANVQEVVNAYASNGQLVPGKLMAYLVQINEERHPEDTYRGASFPWIFAGGALLAYFLFRKRRGRSR